MTKIFNIGIGGHPYMERLNTEDGPIEHWTDVFHIGATDNDGRVWELEGTYTTDEAGAHEMLAELAGCNPETEPERWLEREPVYGSNAWDAEDEYELACFEADAFGEPRPRW